LNNEAALIVLTFKIVHLSKYTEITAQISSAHIPKQPSLTFI